jgi:hypothetical protein
MNLAGNKTESGESTELVNQIDVCFRGLFPAIQTAVNESKTTVALGLWGYTHALSLLPFHLHLRWPDIIETLSLNAQFGFIPFIDKNLIQKAIKRRCD